MARESLTLLTPAHAARALTPGAVTVALHRAFGLRAGEIGALTPRAAGRLDIALDAARAARVPTPTALPVLSADGRLVAVAVLSRETDIPAETWQRVTVTSAAVRPGAVARALASATRGTVGGEELGAGLARPGGVRVAIPSRAHVPAEGATWQADGGVTLEVALDAGAAR